MATDTSFLASINTTLLFVIGLGIILVIIAILYTVDYQLRKKRVLQESTLEYRFSLRLDELKKERIDPKEFIEKAEKLGRDFIEERFKVNSKIDFSQLMETFKGMGKPYAAAFCQTMLELLYSGEKPGLTEARSVLNSLEMMLRQEGILIVVKRKEEPIEQTNIIEEWAKKIQKRLSERRDVEKGTNNELIKKDKESNSIQVKEVDNNSLTPIKKREIIPDKEGKRGKKERKEYKYIESLDSLDRIKSRVQRHQEEKIN